MISSVIVWQCYRLADQNTSVAVWRCYRRKFFQLNQISFILTLFISVILQHCHSATLGAASFFEKHAEGWHWYQDSLSESEVKEEKVKADPALPLQTPTQTIESQRKDLETKLHAAIIDPTQENLIAYILAQKALMDQSQRFSESWQRVVMTTPALDETLIHPVDQNARHIYYVAYHKDIENRIKKLAQDYGLFFFFRNNCPYCHQFAPVVKRFAEKYGWSVLAISLDGGTLPEFPNARRNNGMAEKLQIAHVPALMALHSKTGQLIPLAYGLISESEIENRVEFLTRLSEGPKK